jgi:hypothetical protein
MTNLSANLAERLSAFGLNHTAIAHDRVVTSGSGIRWTDASAPFVVHKKATSDLDELTRWIGNDDSLFTSGGVTIPPGLVANIGDHSHAALLGAAKTYVFGRSDSVAHLKGQIEKTLGRVTVQIAAAGDIVIEPGAPLIIDGTDPKVLAANRLIFVSPQSQLINYGILTINVSTIIVGS